MTSPHQRVGVSRGHLVVGHKDALTNPAIFCVLTDDRLACSSRAAEEVQDHCILWSGQRDPPLYHGVVFWVGEPAVAKDALETLTGARSLLEEHGLRRHGVGFVEVQLLVHVV